MKAAPQKIKVTPEMIEAGEFELTACYGEEEPAAVVVAIYEAMEEVRLSRNQKGQAPMQTTRLTDAQRRKLLRVLKTPAATLKLPR